MRNRFYQEFDLAPLDRGYPRPTEDYRTPFQVDRDRILHTAAFRRLQSKTQVFSAGDYDFYRTRLTHSLEVAQIGRSLCAFLAWKSPLMAEDFCIDPDLVEAICLAHDLGHPPFGHAGERTLHALMRDWGGFEGNAQTLRLITETIYSDWSSRSHCGMNPTRAFLDGVLKYKTLFSEAPKAARHFVYDDQREYLSHVCGGDMSALGECPPGKGRAVFRSLECQVMDWADDTAYSLNDIVDGVRAGFLHIERIENWAGARDLDAEESGWVEALLRRIRERRLEASSGRRIGEFITACEIEEDAEHPLAGLSHRYRYRLRVDAAVRKESALYKDLALQAVFRSERLQQLEHKGDAVLRRLFKVLRSRYLDDPEEGDDEAGLRLLPEALEAELERETDGWRRARLICDYVAGMTDGQALRMYRRLFDADFGSFADLAE